MNGLYLLFAHYYSLRHMTSGGDMLFIDHLKELRNRFLRIVVITIAIMVVCTVFGIHLVNVNNYSFYFLVPTVYNNIASQVTQFLSESLLPPQVELIQTAPGQALFAQIYVAILISITCAVPLIVREILAFVSPAISITSKRKAVLTIIMPTVTLFFAGILFSFYVAVPMALDFLYQYGQSIGVLTFLNISDFINFILYFFIAFGISFQLPLVMYFLSLSGIVGYKFWIKNFKFALLIMIIFGAILTPDGSGLTMWFISLPLLALYSLGILITRLRNPTLD
ncbi:twin-arginine translocase subunit TatC [Candidatus Nitrosocosmicus franklandus]|nr:twin-arginine translocase subunit TatC [Candidatus Nitrosocosmicus franklandus]